MVKGLGFRVKSVEFRVRGLGFRVKGLGLRTFRVSSLGFKAHRERVIFFGAKPPTLQQVPEKTCHRLGFKV